MNTQTAIKTPAVLPAAPAEKPGLYATMDRYFKELFTAHPGLVKKEYTVELLRLDLQARYGINYNDAEILKQCRICFGMARPGVFLIYRYDFVDHKIKGL